MKVYELSYEIDISYFVLGVFTTLEEAEIQFNKVLRNLEYYIEELADLLQIRSFEINVLERSHLNFNIERQKQLD